MAIVFFKREKPRQFEFKNRYFDPDQEARDRRKRKMEERDKNDFNENDFRDELRYRWSLNRESNLPFNEKYTSLRRMLVLIIIALALVAGMYLIGMYLLV
jgi:hypothetical protein